jgi:hypothetical protein
LIAGNSSAERVGNIRRIQQSIFTLVVCAWSNLRFHAFASQAGAKHLRYARLTGAADAFGSLDHD